MKIIKYEILYGKDNLSRPVYLKGLGLKDCGEKDIRQSVWPDVGSFLETMNRSGIHAEHINLLEIRDATNEEQEQQEAVASYFEKYGTACE